MSALLVTTLILLTVRTERVQALTWAWSYSGQNFSAQGTFTTVGVSPPSSNTPYTITSITGTTTRTSDTADSGEAGTSTIQAKGSYSDNTFEWDGQTGLLVDSSGIEYLTSDTSDYILVQNPGTYSACTVCAYTAPQGEIENNYRDGTLSVTASTLTPIITTSVPWTGPNIDTIPVLGSIVALGVMRKVRTFKKANGGKNQFQKV